MPSPRVLAFIAGALLLCSACARNRDQADVSPAQMTEPATLRCEIALGGALGPGLMTARGYALANLGQHMAEARIVLAAQGVRRFYTIRHGVKCKPTSAIFAAGRVYRCSTSAHICEQRS